MGKSLGNQSSSFLGAPPSMSVVRIEEPERPRKFKLDVCVRHVGGKNIISLLLCDVGGSNSRMAIGELKETPLCWVMFSVLHLP